MSVPHIINLKEKCKSCFATLLIAGFEVLHELFYETSHEVLCFRQNRAEPEKHIDG